ncbi:MAG: ABC transporter substrate-binding protein, partial [Geminicoccales bacterium]
VIAFAGPLTGPDAQIGREQRRAIELALKATNQAGGIGGRPVELLTFDDQNDPALAAERAEAIAANDDINLVIGHYRSDTSIAAAPIYEAAGLAAITPSASADVLTEDDPRYFRTVLPNHDQGRLIAAYTRHALGYERASIITTDGPYETSLTEAFTAEFSESGTVVGRWQIDLANRASSIATIVAELQATADPGILVLPLAAEEARDVLLALRRAGSTVPVIGGDTLGYRGFGRLFAAEPEELVHPGFFTNGLYAVTTFMYDGLGGNALAFALQFERAYGTTPEWIGAKAYDAATLAVIALDRLHDAADAPATATARREFIWNTLAANNRPVTAIDGLSGPLYFDASHAVPQMLSFGVFDRGVLLNAPLQYRPVTDPAKFDLAADDAAGLLFELDG